MDFVPEVPRDARFFGTHEAYFLILKEKFGEEAALEAMRCAMERNLTNAYVSMGFHKGNPQYFARVVGERDKSVGLHVGFPVVSDDKIIYQLRTDPFPGLKSHVVPEKLDATYMDFKVSFLLGSSWSYNTTKHLWEGKDCTEHVIEWSQRTQW